MMMKTTVLAVMAITASIVVRMDAQRPTTSTGGDASPIKLAFYNIRSGWGAQPLSGHRALFAENGNCTDKRQPMNAWGAGIVQRELTAKIKDDPAIVALGLAEAWLCANPSAVQQVLGWAAATEERNGTALVARYGFSGAPQWLQLDTSRNENPKDTVWIVTALVCLDARCRQTLRVYNTHWYGTGPEQSATYNRQAAATIDMMSHAGGPHVLIGDLNVFEGPPVCRQQPNPEAINALRRAGYVDAWTAVHGDAEGYTGMVNRKGCGQPEGATWKRIDYAWAKGLTPVGMDRFGVVTPGEAAPSDHYGIIAAFQRPAPLRHARQSAPRRRVRTRIDRAEAAARLSTFSY